MDRTLTGGFQMSELVTTQQQEQGLAISEDTKALIVSGISENTLVAYRRATRSLWQAGGNLHRCQPIMPKQS